MSLGLQASAQAKKAELIAFAYSDSLKRSPQVALFFVGCFCSSPALILSQCGKVKQLSTKFFSALRLAELVRMVFLTSVSGARSRQFEALFSVDGQLGRANPGRYQVPSLGKLENVSNGGFVWLRIQKGHCVNPL